MSENVIWEARFLGFAQVFDLDSEPAGWAASQYDQNNAWSSYASARLDTNFAIAQPDYCAMFRRGIEGLDVPGMRLEAIIAPSENFASPYNDDSYPFLQMIAAWPSGGQFKRYMPAFRWNWNAASGALQVSVANAIVAYGGRTWQTIGTVPPKLHPSYTRDFYRLWMDFDIEAGTLLSVGLDHMAYPLDLPVSSVLSARPSCGIAIGIGLGATFNRGIRVGLVRVLSLPRSP